MLLERLGRENDGALEGVREAVDRLADRLWPFPADGPAGMDANGPTPGRWFQWRRRPPDDGQTPGGGVADTADVPQERQGLDDRRIAVGGLAGRTGGEELERQIPQRPVGHDHELLDPLRERDLRLLEEESFDGDHRSPPVGGDDPIGPHRHVGVEQTQGLRQVGQLPGQCCRLPDLPQGDAVSRLQRPPQPRRAPMKGEEQFARRQPSTDVGRGEERGKLQPERLPAGGELIDQHPAPGRALRERFPIPRLAWRTGPARRTGVAATIPAGGGKERGGERRPQAGILVDESGQFRMASEESCPAGHGVRPQSGGVGAEQALEPQPSPPHRLRIEPPGPGRSLRGSQGRIAATARRDQHPRFVGLGAGRRHRRERGQRIDDKLTRRRVAEEPREEHVGLSVGDRRRPGHHHLHQPAGLEEARGTGAGNG